MPNNDELLNDLKKQLNQELSKNISDNSQLLSIVSQIANLNESKIRFTIDAGVIDRLGKELVARQETAVSEIIKNSYDADASEVILRFIDSDAIGGTLIIEDDGDGMNRDELVNGFMRISSTAKVHSPYTSTYKRKRAGQKGIGRFAVQRLGERLTIITQKEESNNALKLSINWNDYLADMDLLSIQNTLEIIPKRAPQGTTLIIEGLRDKWTQAAIKRIYRYVMDVIQPFILSPTEKQLSEIRITETKDPGFKCVFYKVDDEVSKLISDDLISMHDYALAVIEGYIDENKMGIFSIDSNRLDIHEVGSISKDPDNPTLPFDYLQNVRFRAYYFVYDIDLIPKMHLTSIKRLANSNGGIRLYRNGFRVLPYAEPGDDWLKLDRSLRTRSLLPSHGNNNFFGFVEIKDNNNVFNETSSREGLLENEAFIELQNFIYRTIITGVIRVSETRQVKLIPSQQREGNGWEKIEIRIKNIAHTLDELDKELERDEGNIESKKARNKKVKKLKKEIEEVISIQKSEHASYIKEKSMLRVLSSVGLTIGQFIHEIKYYLDNIQSDVRFLLDKLQNDMNVLERLQILDTNFSSFHTYTSYFDNVISQNVIRDLKPIEVRNVVKPFIRSIKDDAHKSNINFEEPIFNGFRLFTKPMHPSEWSSILFNFYTNSKKAIRRARVDGKILIECGDQEGFIYLEFSDNGDGISKENEEKIFDEFFTTTSPQDFTSISTNTEILGTGLGLKIVKDIVSSYKGIVAVVSPKPMYSTCVRVQIPKASDKDIEKYDL